MNVLKKLIAMLLLAMISTTAFSAVSDNQVFAFAEANYPNIFAGTASAGLYTDSANKVYNYKFYSTSKNYLAVMNGGVYLLGPYTNNQIVYVGPVSTFESQVTGWQASRPASMCDISTAPAGFNYSQSGNTINVTTNGCVAVPAASTCNSFSPRATGVNVLLTMNSPSVTWGGITITNPTYSSILNFMNSGPNICIRNAPDGYTNMTLNENICLDMTQQIGSSFSGIDGITVTNPVTMRMVGTTTMATVPDCTTAGGVTFIYDAYTLDTLTYKSGSWKTLQSDGTFK